MPVHRRLGGRSSHLVVAVAAFLLVALLGAPVAEGVTIKRTWSAAVGTDGRNGTSRIYGYTTGTGFLVTSLRHLGASRTWKVKVHRGTCANLGTKVVGLGSAKTAPDGTLGLNRALDRTRMTAIWKATWNRGAVALRLVSGGQVRCGTYRFPVATRVVVKGMGIDLPVIRGPSSTLYCNVAMSLRELSQPGEFGATLIYAHARTGMFLPLLKASRVDGGASMIGRTVRVFTSSSRYYTYRITQVRRHLKSVQGAFGVLDTKVLWLQTSEGPYATSTKLVVIARQTGGPFATTRKASHPNPRPISC